MALGYLLIVTKEDRESSVAENIVESPLIDNIHSTHGEYNLIAKVKTNNMIELQDFIKEVSKIEGIVRLTALIAKDLTKESNLK